jgi:hypothetical protein
VNDGCGRIVIVTVLLATCAKESVAVTVTVKSPAPVGVPLIDPVEPLMVTPAGRLPALIAQVNGPVPPDTVGCWLSGTPTSPVAGAKATVGLAAIAIVTALLAIWPLASVTWTVNVKLPAVVGVPEMRPVEGPSANPLGRTPAVIDHANGEVPPLTVSCRLYGAPTSPAGGAANTRLGDTLGVTEADRADAGPVPAAFCAVTVKVYAVPGVKPVMDCVVPLPVNVRAVCAVSPIHGVTTYPVMALLPLAGVVQVSVAEDVPAVTADTVGAPGTVYGTTALDFALAVEVPNELVAVTAKV